MPLSWNEIKDRALAFSKEWENTEREEASIWHLSRSPATRSC